MKKKVIILSVVLVLVAAGIIAAVYLNGNNSGDVLSLLEQNDGKSTDLKETKLTFYFEGKEPKAMKDVLNQVQKKAKSKLNVKLDFKFVFDYPQQYLDKVKSTILSGQPCDAFYYSQQFPESLEALVNENVIKDISADFQQNAPNYFAKFSKDEISSASINNKIYAIPNRLPITQMRCALVRDDLMKKYNIPDIKSYDDYEVYLKTIKEKEPNLIPMNFSDSTIGLFAEANGYVVLDYAQGLVYKWDDPNIKIMAWEQTPEFKKGIQTISDWYSKGYLLANIGTAPIDSTSIASGKWGSIVGIFGSEFDYNGILKSKNINWGFKAYPLYPDKASQRNSPMDSTMVISAKSDKYKRVLMFLEWVQSSQENYDSIMYGIKDKNYTLEGDRVALPKDGNESYIAWPWRTMFENVENERVNTSTPEEYAKTYYKTVKEKTQYAPHMGFVPDYTPVSETTSLRQLSFTSTEQKIYTGSFKQEDIDTYIKEQKDNGADALVAEVQRQLDKWRTEHGK